MGSPERSDLVPGDGSGMNARDARTFTLLLVGQITRRGGADGLCRVRNVSPGGLMAEVVMELAANDAVRIDLRNGQSRTGEVRWIKDGSFGMQFDEPIDDIPHFLADPDRPTDDTGIPIVRSPRLKTECSASLMLNGRPYPGIVTDLSQGGARITTTARPDRDQLLTVSIPGLPHLRAVVRWSDTPDLGVSFLDHLSFAALAHWLDDSELRFSRRGKG